MAIDTCLRLTPENIGTMPVRDILIALKTWLLKNDPVCLLHPHGFYVVLLARDAAEEWRLHFWPEGSRTITGMPAFIHTHDRHVESRILQGRLRNVEHESILNSSGRHPIYEVFYEGDRYSSTASNLLRKTSKRVTPKECHTEHIETGDQYRVDRHTFHEAVVSEKSATCSIVRMHGRSPGAVLVVGLDGYPQTITFQRAKFSASVFAEHLTV